MRPRRPLATTYRGLVFLTVIGSAAGSVVSAALFLFRRQCEPIISTLLPLAIRIVLHRGFIYHPEKYYWIAAYISVFSALWFIAGVWTIARKPSDDRRIDRALRLRMRPEARGAPLES